MSREIKFRAWDGEQMLDAIDVEHMMFSCGENYDHMPWHGQSDNRHTDARIMQYTGLKDKNGVEIYEGDVLNVFGGSRDSLQRTCQVVWSEDNGFFDSELIKNLDNSGVFCALHNCKWSSRAEIIGNIYEHPELLIK